MRVPWPFRYFRSLLEVDRFRVLAWLGRRDLQPAVAQVLEDGDRVLVRGLDRGRNRDRALDFLRRGVPRAGDGDWLLDARTGQRGADFARFRPRRSLGRQHLREVRPDGDRLGGVLDEGAGQRAGETAEKIRRGPVHPHGTRRVPRVVGRAGTLGLDVAVLDIIESAAGNDRGPRLG